MKTRKQFLLWMIAFISIAFPVSATGLNDIRVNARFLSDRMAYELNLTSDQYNDLYEVNYDFLRNVDPYLAGVACQDAVALDYYYRYLDERNEDIRWILSRAEYTCFLSLDYFFRPVYAQNNICYLRVFNRYPDRGRFYYRQPLHYLDYCGGHSRAHWHGVSFYERNFAKRYHHPVYVGNVPNRLNHHTMDFGSAPRPVNPGHGSHFTPAQPPRHDVGAHRPPMDNQRPGVRDNRNDNQFRNQPRPESGREPERRPSGWQDNRRSESRQSAPQRQDNSSFNRGRQDGQSVRKENRSDERRQNQSTRSNSGSSNRRQPAQSGSRFVHEM